MSVNFYQTTRRKAEKTDIFILAAMRTWYLTYVAYFLERTDKN
jgi:hypothetical protein